MRATGKAHARGGGRVGVANQSPGGRQPVEKEFGDESSAGDCVRGGAGRSRQESGVGSRGDTRGERHRDIDASGTVPGKGAATRLNGPPGTSAGTRIS